ncbi:O-antigen ligase family protein [Thalassovita mediterranea]|jgi:O-antigen ligase|uniref:Lipid A core-O-antigen ligase n=1 Tax=Thalassovita mediterranea TaxID=340021 RepID=A0A0P1HBJ9_9RHOB|nr:O-antigen ligase family protein [Thalassovita mediterranea]CUH84335.1 Lipid A core-O-antigen ligase [Thalassovita mediterranea]SIS31881.1 O-antigen ligase [Thalassovita mediterranea]
MIDFDADKPRKLREAQRSRVVPAPEQAAPIAPQSTDEGFSFETVTLETKALGGSPRAVSKLNDAMAVILALFLLVVPVPYGANNSLAWLGAAAVLAMLCAGYYTLILLLDPQRPSKLRDHPWVLGFGVLAIAGTIWQVSGVQAPALTLPSGQVQLSQATVAASASQLAVIRLISYGVLFVMMLEVCTNQLRIERMLSWIYAGIIVHAVWALVSLGFLGDTLLLGEKTAYLGYATGTFVNRNSFATFLAMGTVIGTARFMMAIYGPRARSPRRRAKSRGLTMEAVVHLGWLAILLAALAATGSRMGAFVGFLGMGSVATVILLKNGTAIWKILLSGAVLAVLLPVAMLIGGESGTMERAIFGLAQADARTELFRQTWHMIMQRPFVGYGADSYPLAFELYRTPELSAGLTWQAPHNTYLTLWSDYGLILGSVTMLAVVAALISLLRAIRRRELAYLPAAIAVAVIVLTGAHSLVDFSLEIAANVYVFIALVALGLAKRAHSRA